MYSQAEIDDAVAAGAIDAGSATALRAHVQRMRDLPIQDEEQIRLITSFNDIFVSIAAAILLFAVAWIGQQLGQDSGLIAGGDGPSPLAPLAVAAAAWALALFFTARRRMALPSILLALAFVGGIFFITAIAGAMLVGEPALDDQPQVAGLIAAVSGVIAAGAAFVHWRRFRVPITVAAGAGAAAAIAVGLLAAAVGEDSQSIILGAVLLLGLGIFIVAMRWDSSDRARVTRRSDVAFWLHLLAAPMIVHPVFTLLGLNDGNVAVSEGLIVVLLYIGLGIAALAIDRRALLVSALAYVLWSLSALFERFGAVELNIALTALVIGSGLLLLSAFWHQARAAIVGRLPGDLQSRLPLADRPVSLQPAA